MPPDYKNCVIYKIINEEETFCYVGHTTNFGQRKSEHKERCNNENGKQYNYNLYKTIRENGGWNKFKIVLFESYPCDSKRDAETREQFHINALKPNMNDKNSYTNIKEYKKQYRESNKEVIAQYKKEYYENNKEAIAEQRKQYRESNKEVIAQYKKEYYENNKEAIAEQRKEYRENNKEKLAEQRKEHYEANKEKISDKRKEKIECECGSFVTINHKQRHFRSKKHIQFISRIASEE